ncbi:MAG: arginine decarboxylase, partial [Oligoflexales bacterium]|nr:arginine decarboxylase [Oligoflexales bacterium]
AETFIPLEELNLNINENSHKSLLELKYILENITHKNFVEYYHDAHEYYDELFTLFNLGYVNLEDRGAAEQLFNRICQKSLYFSYFDRHQLEEFEELQLRRVSKFLANFSIFQSIPDAWAIHQLFPVMPISKHDVKPSHKATIVDITCDSDGCLEKFVDRRDVKDVLDLHTTSDEEPYYLGFFLVGAYQESLASEHNLFGATDEVEVMMNTDGKWQVTKITKGDPISELLEGRNYNIGQIITSYNEMLKDSVARQVINEETYTSMYEYLKLAIHRSPYLYED